MDESTRREFCALAGGAAMLAVTLRPAEATPAMLATAIRNVVGTATVKTGKVKLEIPPLVENGNTVPMTVTVESPMTDASHVTEVLVLADGNPNAGVATFHFSPASGVAEANTRIRLAASQNIIAVAKMNDGSFVMASKQVKVTIGGCGG